MVSTGREIFWILFYSINSREKYMFYLQGLAGIRKHDYVSYIFLGCNFAILAIQQWIHWNNGVKYWITTQGWHAVGYVPYHTVVISLMYFCLLSSLGQAPMMARNSRKSELIFIDLVLKKCCFFEILFLRISC